MAKKRSTSGSTRRAKKKSGISLSDQMAKIIGSVAILLLVVIAAAVLAYHLLVREPARPQAPAKAPTAMAVPRPTAPKRPAAPQQAGKPPQPEEQPSRLEPPARRDQPSPRPTYEVFPKKEREFPHKALPARPPALPEDGLPVVAIIIDDIGYDRQIARNLLDLDVPVTFSMLPFGPHTDEITAEAKARGNEIMLHLPMEPVEYPQVDPGPGALLTRMTPDELIDQLGADLARLDGLKGVNNHMGSALSASPEHLRQIFTVLKKRGLFYIDSRTTPETAARLSAEKLQVPFAERDIFLDHVQSREFIEGQLEKLIARAKRQGYAVAIGHPHPETCQALAKYIPKLKKQVRLVPASKVVLASETAHQKSTQAVARQIADTRQKSPESRQELH